MLMPLNEKIKTWGRELGFSQVGIASPFLDDSTRDYLTQWLSLGFHGEMTYLARKEPDRGDPKALVSQARSVIMVRLDYLPPDADSGNILSQKDKAYISRYALGRDYHRLIRKRLEKLAQCIAKEVGDFTYRPVADSAPLMEKPLAQKAGIGFIGKHTNLITPKAGSWFFLGALLTDLELVLDEPFEKNHCGSCTACMTVCPTQAIVAPYTLDASRCISYLTIELKTAIPEALRPLIGNRIYGCDDCQLVCPWNKFAKVTKETAFHARYGLHDKTLIDVFLWDEVLFLQQTEGSAIRRIGHERWLRNVAVALGNAPRHPDIIQALKTRLDHESALVREHVQWALAQHGLNDMHRSEAGELI
jgi:epoxyqueuosine reductase